MSSTTTSRAGASLSVRFAIMFLAVLGITACTRSFDNRYSPTRLASDALTRKELGTLIGSPPNAYSAVEQLRPTYLMTLPGSADEHGREAQIRVFINGFLAGDADVLKMISVASIESIRRIEATMVTVRTGDVRAGDSMLMIRLR